MTQPPHNPPGPYQPPPPPPPPPRHQPPQQPPGPPGSRRGVVILTTAVVVLVLVAVGAGAWWLGTQSAGQEKKTTQNTPPPKGPDDARPVEVTVATGAEGGPSGRRALQGLRGAGFDCSGATHKSETVLHCARTLTLQKRKVPTVQTVRLDLVGGRLAQVSAQVRLDPTARELENDTDSNFDDGLDATKEGQDALNAIAAAVFPAGELPGVRTIIGEAGREGAGTKSLATSAGRTTALVSSTESTLGLTGPDQEVASVPSGLEYVGVKELEKTVRAKGLNCNRDAETLICRKGGVNLKVIFPRGPQEGDEQRITKLTIEGDAGGKATIGDLAGAVTRTVVAKVTKPGEATAWVGDCFTSGTREGYFGASALTCQRHLTGKLKSPQTKSFSFTLE